MEQGFGSQAQLSGGKRTDLCILAEPELAPSGGWVETHVWVSPIWDSCAWSSQEWALGFFTCTPKRQKNTLTYFHLPSRGTWQCDPLRPHSQAWPSSEVRGTWIRPEDASSLSGEALDTNPGAGEEGAIAAVLGFSCLKHRNIACRCVCVLDMGST